MAVAVSAGDNQGPNHPLATRMAVIAFMAHNVVISSIFGTTAILLKPMAERLGVSLKAASVGAPMVMVGSAIMASAAGALAARYSLKVLLAAAAVVLALGWIILGVSHSYLWYLIAYGLCLGPAMAVGGQVLPPTLVTRWFSRNRGLATGLAHLSLFVAIMPKLADWVIVKYGLEKGFFALAAFAVITLLPAAMKVIDHPPGAAPAKGAAASSQPVADGGIGVWGLVRSPIFWAVAVAAMAMNTSSVVMGVHLTSMAESLGYGHDRAVNLQSLMSFFGIIGMILYGWVADRIGGVRTIAILASVDAVCWFLMSIKLPYEAMVLVTGLIGVHGAGVVPAMAKAFSGLFGQADFSRAFGLTSTVTLPVIITGVIGTATVVEQTGAYTISIYAMTCYFVLAVVLALLVSRKSKA